MPSMSDPTALLAVARFAAAIARLSLGPLLPLLSTSLGFSDSHKPSLLASYSTGYLLTQIVGGFLADRCGARTVVASGSAIGAILLLTLSLARPVTSEGAAMLWTRTYLLLGLASGPLFPATSAEISSGLPPDRRAGAAAVVDAAAAGGTCAASLAPMAAEVLGWRRTLGWTAMVLGLVASWAYALQRRHPRLLAGERRVEEVEKRQSCGGAVKASSFPLSALLSPSALCLYACHSCENFTKYVLNAWLATMFAESHGAPPAVAGVYLAVQEAVGVLSRVCWGMLVDSYVGPRLRGAASGVAFMSQAGLLLLAFRASTAGSCAMLLIGSAAVAGAHSVGFRPRYFETVPEHAGVLSGFGNTIASLSSAVGPVVVGVVVSQQTGSEKVSDSGSSEERWERVGHVLLLVNALGALAAVGLVRRKSHSFTGVTK